MAHLRFATAIVLVVGLVSLATAVLKSPEPNIATRLIAALVGLRSAEVAFAASCGRGGYASSLARLDTAFLDAPNVMFAGLRVELNAMPGARSDARDCDGYPTTRVFYATAAGGRGWPGPTFALDSNGTLWRSEGDTPPLPPFTAPGLSVVR
jgi:hypothetical protein